MTKVWPTSSVCLVLTMLLASVLPITAGGASSQAARRITGERARPTMAQPAFKRPLMRSGRIQYCLKRIGRFDGRIVGRQTPATVRALRRLSVDFELQGDDYAQDWALHAVLWRQCREPWLADGGVLDRFGMPQAVSVERPVLSGSAKPSNQVVPSSANLNPPSPSSPAASSLSTDACLPADLRELALKRGRRDIGLCDLPCVPQPTAMARQDAQALERRHGFAFCRTCVPFSGSLAIDDIARIEKAGNVTLCTAPSVESTAPAAVARPTVMIDALRGTRGLFRRDIRPGEHHAGVAVVISVSPVMNDAAVASVQERDAAGVRALLVERLGFRSNRVIELKNPTRSEIEGVIGRGDRGGSLLRDRLREAPESPVFIYFAGQGTIEDDVAYLLAADGSAARARGTGYALTELYRSAGKLGTGPVVIVLEADFGADARTPVVAPNVPTTEASALPSQPAPALVVITAADRDQRPLIDRDSGLSLFTRYLIEAMSGYADMTPIGNGDGGVDTTEAFIYAANRTQIAARKLHGVLQRPTISQSPPVVIGRLGPPLR